MNTVKDIHQSDIYGCFIETGCGVPVANALLNVSGASKTIYMTECPYSQEYVQQKYQIPKEYRAVSREYVHLILQNELLYHLTFETKVNTIYVASFQVGQHNDIVTHGWIGLWYQTNMKFYHITIRQSLSRSEYINRIGEIGLELIWARNQISSMNLDVDMVIDGQIGQIDYFSTLQLMSPSGVISFNTKNEICRLEDICRDQKQLIVYKGSFNPPTRAHLKLAESTQEAYPDAKFVFMISVNTVDKGEIPLDDLIRRMGWLTHKLGYPCLIMQGGRFREAIDYFKTHYPQMELIFPIGEDIRHKMETDLFTSPGVIISTFNRPEGDISSTLARKAIADQNWAELQKLVPESIFSDLKT